MTYGPDYPPDYGGGIPTIGAAAPGLTTTLYFDFYDETTGLLVDPASVQLDITYGEEIGFAPDVAGPFFYTGASVPSSGQIYRLGVGEYAFAWSVPLSALSGVYVANWTATYAGEEFLGFENFPVTGGTVGPPGAPSGDVGYWTGSIIYNPAPGNLAQLTGVGIPLGATDANGITWLLQKIEGWDGPDVQGGGVIPRSGDHGAWASPQFYAARTLTLTVTAMAPSQALRDTARALLQEAVPISDLALFTYDEPIPKAALVRRSGKLTEAYPDLASVTFTVGLVAPDPRKYSVAASTASANAQVTGGLGFVSPFTLPLTPPAQAPAGSAAATNAGTFETRPTITITGPITSPALTNVTTGQTVSWTGLVMAASDALVVDFDTRQGLLNGVFRPADLPSSWWVLPPGTSTIQLGGQASSGAGFVAEWQSAWV